MRLDAGLWLKDEQPLGNLVIGTEQRNGNAFDGSYAVQFGTHQLSGPLVMVAEKREDTHYRVAVVPLDPPLFVRLVVNNDDDDAVLSGVFKYGEREGSVIPNKKVPEQTRYEPLAVPQPPKELPKPEEPNRSSDVRLLFCTLM